MSCTLYSRSWKRRLVMLASGRITSALEHMYHKITLSYLYDKKRLKREEMTGMQN